MRTLYARLAAVILAVAVLSACGAGDVDPSIEFRDAGRDFLGDAVVPPDVSADVVGIADSIEVIDIVDAFDIAVSEVLTPDIGPPACLLEPSLCDDGEFCTRDRCDDNLGCVNVPRASACDDGDPCTEGDLCEFGRCRAGRNLCPCEADDDCLLHDDGDPCTGTFRCESEGCRIDPSSVVHCPHPSPGSCVWSQCNPSTGGCEERALADGHPCSDGDRCTTYDRCDDGFCAPGFPLSCDDGNDCTEEHCDPEVGCLSTPVIRTCSDGSGCTEGDLCSMGVCLPGSENDCLEETCHAAQPLLCGTQRRWARDADSATDFVVEYDCGDEVLVGLDGPEFAYAVVAPFDGSARISAVDVPEYTELLLLEGGIRGCDARMCRGTAEPDFDFRLSEGKTYYVVLDAPSGVTPEFEVSLDCRPDREIDCVDGRDDDEDGQVDCADADCRSEERCGGFDERPIYELGCGLLAEVGGHTRGAGSTDERSVYGCGTGYELLFGNELRYGFRAPISGFYGFRIEAATGPLELVALLPSNEGGGCLVRGSGSIELPMTAGREIVVVIDGADESGASFVLSTSCPQGAELDCTDGFDDDGDGTTDCADEDCASVAACIGGSCPSLSSALTCGDRIAATTDTVFASSERVDYPCSLFPFIGPELLFPVNATEGRTVVARLDEAGEDLDVFLLSVPQGGSCDTEHCVSQGDETARFRVREGENLYAVVDGYGGTSGPFSLAIDCYASREERCDDGEDDDADGEVDCDDEDCFESPSCPSCTPNNIAVLGCDEPYRVSTRALAATNRVSRYGCSANDYSGPERVFALDALYSGRVTFWLDERNADLDVIVLEGVDGDCRPERCIAHSPYRVRTTLAGGHRYFVVIDGYDGAVGEATLTLECEDW